MLDRITMASKPTNTTNAPIEKSRIEKSVLVRALPAPKSRKHPPKHPDGTPMRMKRTIQTICAVLDDRVAWGGNPYPQLAQYACPPGLKAPQLGQVLPGF